MTTSRKLIHGWKPELPDFRDYPYIPKTGTPPPRVDLSGAVYANAGALVGYPPAYDQGQLGSCVGNGVAGHMHIEEVKQNDEHASTPSRLFIYYFARLAENDVKRDAGAQIRDGIKAVATLGVPPETLWPYKPAKFATKPSTSAVTAAKGMDALVYYRVDNSKLDAMLSCLGIDRQPIVGGFTVYDSFEGDKVSRTGVLDMPASSENVVGGHCILIVGYDMASSRFIVRNSWGTDWGIKGHFTVPFAYFTNPNLADDFWTIQKVS